MTYRELQVLLTEFSEEQLDQDITIHDILYDDYFPATLKFIQDDCQELDMGHPIIEQKR